VSELSEADVCAFLTEGDLEVLGLMPYASNATLLARVQRGEQQALAVYKPRRGERPLWDFPSGTLCLRERAAYVLSHELGWNLVPPTVLREGPAGFGALQFYIEEDENADVREIVGTHPVELRTLALFDVVINNADRKAGHLLIDTNGRLWSIDHGVCFSDEPKLRTVVWAFEGEDIAANLLEDLARFADSSLDTLAELLDPAERDALCTRIATLLKTKRYPSPDPGRHHVPWPPW
jgi:uncharacterized repeat protein (TIGR03843 family)